MRNSIRNGNTNIHFLYYFAYNECNYFFRLPLKVAIKLKIEAHFRFL